MGQQRPGTCRMLQWMWKWLKTRAEKSERVNQRWGYQTHLQGLKLRHQSIPDDRNTSMTNEWMHVGQDTGTECCVPVQDWCQPMLSFHGYYGSTITSLWYLCLLWPLWNFPGFADAHTTSLTRPDFGTQPCCGIRGVCGSVQICIIFVQNVYRMGLVCWWYFRWRGT